MAVTFSPASSRTTPLLRHTGRTALLLGSFLLGGLLMLGALFAVGLVSVPGHSKADRGSADEQNSTEEKDLLKLPQAKWKAAGIEIRPAVKAALIETAWRTGKVTFNERRVAHISPLVEGIVRDVRTRLGQDVKAGDVLVVIDSKELGQAKLELVKARLARGSAQAQFDWTQTVNKNTEDMLRDMANDLSVSAIEGRFRGRAIGDWREKLVSAYARRLQKKAQYDSLQQVASSGAASATSLRSAKADYESAEATYQALSEELNFQNRQVLRAMDQKLREAQTQLSVSSTTLMMMGYPRHEVEALDPVAEGAQIAHYPIRAPFDGTVLTLAATLAERVSPQAAVLQLGDLSSVWVQADIPEADVPIVHDLKGKKVAFKGLGLPAGVSAEVFHIGDLVDKTTRTVPLLASADNAQRLLRPGMLWDPLESTCRHASLSIL